MVEILLAAAVVGVIALICGVGLSFASKFLAVPTEKKFEAVRAALPGANCGACGFSGCDGYAEAIAKGEAECNKCPVGGEKTAAELSEILGVEVTVTKQVAFVACGKTDEKTVLKYRYDGINTCAAAALLYNGPLACQYGCIGLGDCAAACDQKAISLEGGVARVDKDLCGACGLCAKACPKGLISILPADYKLAVACSNKDKGGVAMKACKNACIGCTKCAKNCPTGAITITDNLASINQELCTGCGECAKVCPNGCIIA